MVGFLKSDHNNYPTINVGEFEKTWLPDMVFVSAVEAYLHC